MVNRSMATLDDEDAGVTNVEWQWYRLGDNASFTEADQPTEAACPDADADDPVDTASCRIT